MTWGSLFMRNKYSSIFIVCPHFFLLYNAWGYNIINFESLMHKFCNKMYITTKEKRMQPTWVCCLKMILKYFLPFFVVKCATFKENMTTHIHGNNQANIFNQTYSRSMPNLCLLKMCHLYDCYAIFHTPFIQHDVGKQFQIATNKRISIRLRFINMSFFTLIIS